MEYIVPSITFLLGLAAAFVFIFFQSKEILKQTIYKEKLNYYRDLLQLITIIHHRLVISQEISYSKQEIIKSISELLNYILMGTYISNPDVLVNASEYCDYSKLHSKEESKRKELIDSLKKLIRSIRQDLGIEILSYEIQNLFNI